MYQKNRKQQNGFAALTMILLVVVLMAIIGGVIAASRTNSQSTSGQSAKMFASSIVEQGNTLRIGFDQMMAKGSSVTSIVFNATDTNYGLFNPTVGAASAQSVNASALLPTLTGNEGKWIYRPAKLIANGVGTAAADYAVVVGGLSQTTCQQVNLQMHNSVTIPAAGVAEVAFYSAGALTDSTDNTTAITDLSGVAGVLNWESGCVSTSDATPVYVYYNVVAQQ